MFSKILQKFTGKHLCQILYINEVCGAQKETPAQVLSCVFCDTFKNNFLKNTSVRLLLDRMQM